MITKAHDSLPLVLSVPATMTFGSVSDHAVIVQTARGFRVSSASGAEQRVSIEASVELTADRDAPRGAWPLEKRVDERVVHYRVEKKDGGSGGTAYDVFAWEQAPAGYLRYWQGDLVEEPAGPQFDLLWTVVMGTRATGVAKEDTHVPASDTH